MSSDARSGALLCRSGVAISLALLFAYGYFFPRWADWNQNSRFDLVLAADVLYERPYAPLVARAVIGALSPYGTALIADPGRVALNACLAECATLGAVVRQRRSVRHEEGDAKHTITIYEVRLG